MNIPQYVTFEGQVIPEFYPFPKMARLSRECIITEKIDGTNASVWIADTLVVAGSRTRYLLPSNDNFGFAAWVEQNRTELLKLGPGRHFGEWWGHGIQRGYGLPPGARKFSLFNVSRFHKQKDEPRLLNPVRDPKTPEKWSQELPSCCDLVPVLYQGVFDTAQVHKAMVDLLTGGSRAMLGYGKPEGVVVWHVAANIGFKKTFDGDAAKGTPDA